eukprot:Rmarinus@m.21055
MDSECWAYDTFVDNESDLEDLKCPICLGVAREAVMCLSCQSPFGLACLRSALCGCARGACPCCRKSLAEEVPARIVRGLVGKLRVHCSNHGCEEKPALQSLKDHLDSCKYGTVTCVNDGCDHTCARYAMDTHETVCEAALIECPQHCLVRVFRKDLQSHIQTSCLLRRVSCQVGCDWVGVAGDLSEHLNSCPLVDVKCPQGCGVSFPRRDEREHVLEQCLRAYVDCTNEGCGHRMPRENLESHVSDSCPKRKIHCSCGISFAAETETSHKMSCDASNPPFGLDAESCPVTGCVVPIKPGQIADHLENSYAHHTMLLVAEVSSLKSTISSLRTELRETREQLRLLCGASARPADACSSCEAGAADPSRSRRSEPKRNAATGTNISGDAPVGTVSSQPCPDSRFFQEGQDNNNPSLSGCPSEGGLGSVGSQRELEDDGESTKSIPRNGVEADVSDLLTCSVNNESGPVVEGSASRAACAAEMSGLPSGGASIQSPLPACEAGMGGREGEQWSSAYARYGADVISDFLSELLLDDGEPDVPTHEGFFRGPGAPRRRRGHGRFNILHPGYGRRRHSPHRSTHDSQNASQPCASSQQSSPQHRPHPHPHSRPPHPRRHHRRCLAK